MHRTRVLGLSGVEFVAPLFVIFFLSHGVFWSRGASLQSVVPRTLKPPINPKKPWLNPHSSQSPTLPAFFQPVYFFFHFPYFFEKVANCLAKDNSGTMAAKSIHFKLDQKLFAPL